MNWDNIGILLGFGAIVGYVGYTICLFNLVRLIVFGYFVYSSYEHLLLKEYGLTIISTCICVVFIIRFYRFNPYFFSRLLKPLIFLFRGSAEAGKFALSVADGTLTGRKKLQQERAEFKREKAFYEEERRRQAEEWENIKRAWEKLFEEREQWEREKAGGQRQDRKQEYKEYEESREKTKTDRYFKGFAKFDLEKFEKNDPYEVLRVGREASKKEVLLAYKNLIVQFHPDKFHNAPRTQQEEAHKIACLLNWCREQILN